MLQANIFVILSISIDEKWQSAKLFENINNEAIRIYNISRDGYCRYELSVANVHGSLETLQLLLELVSPLAKLALRPWQKGGLYFSS